MKPYSAAFFACLAAVVLARCGGEPTPERSPYWNPLATDIIIERTANRWRDDCDKFRSTLPADYEAATIEVPENWDDPRSPKIKVFYYRKSGLTGVPILFFNGGPAADSHFSYLVLKEKAEQEKTPFVFMDQRGTGCSDPYPTTLSIATAQRLAHYGSSAIVRDADFLRQKLGVAKWKIYGQSMGGWTVHRYIERLPGTLTAAYAHGSALSVDSVMENVHRLLSQKRVASLYFAKYPDDAELLVKARERIREDLCFSDGTTRICGHGVLDSAVVSLGFQTHWENLHKWIEASNTEDETAFHEWIKSYATGFFFESYLSTNGFAASVISQVESSVTGDLDVCVLAQQELRRQGELPLSWPFNECRLLMEQKWNGAVVAVKKRDPYRLDLVAQNLAEFPKLPLYLYAGRMDALTPTELYATARERLKGRVIYREFPDSGHEGFYTEAQIWADLALEPL